MANLLRASKSGTKNQQEHLVSIANIAFSDIKTADGFFNVVSKYKKHFLGRPYSYYRVAKHESSNNIFVVFVDFPGDANTLINEFVKIYYPHKALIFWG